jgi:hypothetical protein
MNVDPDPGLDFLKGLQFFSFYANSKNIFTNFPTTTECSLHNLFNYLDTSFKNLSSIFTPGSGSNQILGVQKCGSNADPDTKP